MEGDIVVGKDQLVAAVQQMRASGARFASATCLDLGDEFEIIYHFEPQASPVPLASIRLRIGKADALPSICDVYACAALTENEMRDHFGMDIDGLALDFHKRFLRGAGSPEAGLIKPSPNVLRPPARLPVRCGDACPAGIDIPRYVWFTGEGRFDEALAVIRQAVPLAGILGRVCFAPCEDNCRKAKQEDPIAIRMLKRFVYDHAVYVEERGKAETGKSVAVVGSGPAGLTAAYYLARMGHAVTVYEALPRAGGMMRVGIPAYRLPRKVLDADIDVVRKSGVEIRTGSRVESLDGLFDEGHTAIIVATGAHQGVRLGIEGEGHPAVTECIDFLRKVSFGESVDVGERVAVIGGGNAAIDGARTALRLGATDVTMYYRRTEAEMPANASEIEEALREGVKIEFLVAPTRVFDREGGVRLECIRMRLGAPDASGRPRPEPIEDSEFQVDVDLLIAAIGQHPEVPQVFGLRTGRGNVLAVHRDAMDTSRRGVFAAGDAVDGPSSVVEAIGSGKRAAVSVDRYLGGEGVLPDNEVSWRDLSARETFIDRWAAADRRVEMPSLPVEERVRGFEEVELGLTEEMARVEGRRCWRCDLEG